MSRALGRKGKKGSKKQMGHSVADREMITVHRGAANALEQRCMGDLTLKPPGVGLTQVPPRNWRNQIVWQSDTTELTTNYVSGGTTFVGQSFTLSSFTTLNAMATLYDQYCIYAVVCKFEFNITNSGVSPGVFLSAIDFDNASTPTGPGALEDYESFEMMPIVSGGTQTRLVKPCVTPIVFQSGTLVSSYSVARQWIDSADNSVPHFGIKYGVSKNTSPVAGTNYYTMICGFKNKF